MCIRDSGSADAWLSSLCEAIELPWPVVAQRLVPSERVDINYYDANDNVRRLPRAHTRLRSFLLRDGDDVCDAGTHLTACAAPPVSEATDAVQTPVIIE